MQDTRCSAWQREEGDLIGFFHQLQFFLLIHMQPMLCNSWVFVIWCFNPCLQQAYSLNLLCLFPYHMLNIKTRIQKSFGLSKLSSYMSYMYFLYVFSYEKNLADLYTLQSLQIFYAMKFKTV